MVVVVAVFFGVLIVAAVFVLDASAVDVAVSSTGACTAAVCAVAPPSTGVAAKSAVGW